MTTMVVKRGDIFYADLSPVIGSEQGGIRPVIIIQNDIGNKYSPTVIVAAITSQINKAKLPTHVEISSEEYGLNRDSVVLLEHLQFVIHFAYFSPPSLSRTVVKKMSFRKSKSQFESPLAKALGTCVCL